MPKTTTSAKEMEELNEIVLSDTDVENLDSIKLSYTSNTA